MILNFKKGWKILQDVHDAGEMLGIYKPDFSVDQGNQISEWEDLPELKHLQLIYAQQPYFGRELRYFNQAPWWYRYEFDVPEEEYPFALLRFTNVDYYCRVWLNGEYIGEHEGYSIPFDFRVDNRIIPGQKNVLIVKVWSPWDTEICNNRQDRRTYLVYRNSVKGTYEHSDTFVQRDANPVGIYGEVTLTLCKSACITDRPEIDYTLSDDLADAHIRAKVPVADLDNGDYKLLLICKDHQTREKICDVRIPVSSSGDYWMEADAKHIRLWNTWDKGGVWLYEIEIRLLCSDTVIQSCHETIGFRKIEMVRDPEKTRFYLNGKAFYVRGTSYFPDLYVSNMCYERYKRDLLNIKAAGFNLIRIHVHVDLPVFYELCSEIGIGIMQDSEFNWMHPASDEFAERFIRVYLDTIRMLKRHSSMFCWICMNEPGLEDPMGMANGRAMTINPGPMLYKSVQEMDPSRPAIKGSSISADLTSGDSHNYTGSLNGNDGHYADIFGTVEKLNTEYGFDAPPCIFSLMKCPPALKRLSGIMDRLEEIGEYQYHLLKYYTEHYRMQKYAPNSGYVQFLFSDMCPQSFYGIYDWWGLPKRGLDAILESNQPVGVFLRYSKTATEAIYVVNDNPEPLGDVSLRCIFTDSEGNTILEETRQFKCGDDTLVKVCDLHFEKDQVRGLSCALVLTRGGMVIARNRYTDLFNMPEHVKGHPERISHEIGMRLYFA